MSSALFELNFKLSFLGILLLKYFAYLKFCFLFILLNFGSDAFLFYLNATLHKLAKSNYYKESDWQTLRNSYQSYLVYSSAFSGDYRRDRNFFIKSIFIYLFIYLNIVLFFFFTVTFFFLNFFFFFIFFF